MLMLNNSFLLDTCAFIKLSTDEQLLPFLNRLIDLQKKGIIMIYASISAIEELSSIIARNKVVPESIIFNYFRLAQYRIIKPWNDLLFEEASSNKAIGLSEILIDDHTVIELLKLSESVIKNENISNDVLNDILEVKRKYEIKMNESRECLKKDIRSKALDSSDARKGFKELFLQRFEYYESLGKSIFGNELPDIKQLPHINSFLDFFFATLLKSIANEMKHKANDSYDRSIYVESTGVSYLITDDRSFIDTCSIIDGDRPKVVQLKDLGQILSKYNEVIE
jgi:hypothetical protein